MTTRYDDKFYEQIGGGSDASARVVVPLLRQLLHPASVVDVGCGLGLWLAVFVELGVADIVGVDGSHVTRDRLQIPDARFIAHDLRLPLALPRQFDLVLCLEVAEHLPPPVGDTLIESLTHLGRVVVFSAAVPGQGGVEHQNEQWPEYWAARFHRYDFVAVDCIRPLIWRDLRVEPWYAQNAVVYVSREVPDSHPAHALLTQATLPLALVHPRLHERALQDWAAQLCQTRSLGGLVRELPSAVRRVLWHGRRGSSSGDGSV